MRVTAAEKQAQIDALDQLKKKWALDWRAFGLGIMQFSKMSSRMARTLGVQ